MAFSLSILLLEVMFGEEIDVDNLSLESGDLFFPIVFTLVSDVISWKPNKIEIEDVVLSFVESVYNPV